MLPALYSNHKRIVQTGTHVMILVEMNHDARVIRVNSEHDAPSVRKWLGDYTWPATTDKVYEYACHEGNYGMGNIMRGARLLEAEALAATAGTSGGE